MVKRLFLMVLSGIGCGIKLMAMEMKTFSSTKKEVQLPQSQLVQEIRCYQEFRNKNLDIVLQEAQNSKKSSVAYAFLTHAGGHLYETTPHARKEFLDLQLAQKDIDAIVQQKLFINCWLHHQEIKIGTSNFDCIGEKLYALGVDSDRRVWAVSSSGCSLLDCDSFASQRKLVPLFDYRAGAISLNGKYAVGMSGKRAGKFGIVACRISLFNTDNEKEMLTCKFEHGGDAITVTDNGSIFAERQKKEARELMKLWSNDKKLDEQSVINLKNISSLGDSKQKLNFEIMNNTSQCYAWLSRSSTLQILDLNSQKALQAITASSKVIREVVYDGASGLVMLDERAQIMIVDLRSNKIVTSMHLKPPYHYSIAMALSPCSSYVSVGFGAGDLRILDVRNGRQFFQELAISPNLSDGGIYKLIFNKSKSLIMGYFLCNKNGARFLHYQHCSIKKRSAKTINTSAELLAYLGNATEKISDDCPHKLQKARTKLVPRYEVIAKEEA